MIVQTMTSEEIANELNNDFHCNVDRKLQHLYKDATKAYYKNGKKRTLIIREYKSPRKNNWILFITCLNAKKQNYYILPVVYTMFDGFQLYLYNNSYQVSHYTGHFFERYNERFLNGDDVSMLDIVKKYFPKNSTTSCKDYINHIGEEGIFGITEDGVLLGYEDEYITHFNTYINPDMLFDGGQSELYDEGLAGYEDYRGMVRLYEESMGDIAA